MRVTLLLLTAAALAMTGCTKTPTTGGDDPPKTEEDQTFYALGVAMATSLEPFELSEHELSLVQAGLAAGVAGEETDLDLDVYGPKLNELRASRVKAAADKEKTAATQYLEQMAATDGAQQFESGLIMFELAPGSGASPAATDTVEVHYHGTLRDGTVFDSSVDRGTPTTFPLNRVISCWTEGVQKMQVGGKSRLICPSSIAYGDRGSPPKIPPGAVLVFEVELLNIQ